MAKPEDHPTSAAEPSEVIVAAIVAWIEGVADLHREVAIALEELRRLSLPLPVNERLSELVVLLRQRQAQAPTRTAVETWVRSIAGGAGRPDVGPAPAR
jgi:hypothetical protein